MSLCQCNAINSSGSTLNIREAFDSGMSLTGNQPISLVHILAHFASKNIGHELSAQTDS